MLKNHRFQIIFWGFIVLGTIQINAQDIHFSQFSQTPLSVNPAYTGMFEGNWRFTNNYRNQWSAVGTPFNTISAGFDKALKFHRKKIGFGIYLLNDQSGSANLTTNKIMLSIAYQYYIKKHIVVTGIQAGYSISNYDSNQLTFPGQYNDQSGIFDSNLPNYLNNWDESVNYLDLNIGFAWRSKFNNISPTIGLSVHHINNPKLSFLNEGAKLAPRFAINASAYINLQNMWYAKPNLYTNYQKSASNYLVGGIVGYKFAQEKLLDMIYAGAQLRTQFHSTDAFVAIVGVGIMDFDFGISYDINVSGLRKATNMRGAIELSIVYTNLFGNMDQITIPCDRY